jgi:iron complex outermembrane recepter protein
LQPRSRYLGSLVVSGLLLLATPLACRSQAVLKGELGDANLQELLNLEVTSVSKKQQKVSRSPAAIYVLTRDEIRRSGAITLPDLLRLVPGVQVARINNSEWAVSARGFNGRLANKLLVMIDGRRVYSPEFSGVYWDAQDLLIEDIERIEVIRGPGATMWGANAVNGVINILTRHARDTQGGLATLAAGTEQQPEAGLRYGGKLAEGVFYRAWGKYFRRRFEGAPTNLGTEQRWDAGRGGFRLDWDASRRDAVLVEGEVYRSSIHAPFQPVSTSLDSNPARLDINQQPGAGFLMGQWKREFSSRSSTALQFSYERSQEHGASFAWPRATFDLDFQHRILLGRRHDLVWGLSARSSSNADTPQSAIVLGGARRNNLGWFAQDDLALVPEQLHLSMGVKIEHYTGQEAMVQPGVQLLWTPRPRLTLWSSVARAIRAPSRSDTDLHLDVASFPSPAGLLSVVLVSSPGFRPESLLSFEVGQRWQASSQLSLDVVLFHNHYRHLRTLEPGLPSVRFGPGPPQLILPVQFGNLADGVSRGAEASAAWAATARWDLRATYSWLNVAYRPYASSLDTFSYVLAGTAPRHQGRITSAFDLSARWNLEATLALTSRLRAEPVPGFADLRSRVAYKVRPGLELSLAGENLLNHRHPEWDLVSDSLGRTSEDFGRSLVARIVWRF